MELYRKVRLACADGMSKRAAARHFNISRDTVDKAVAFSVPPGYRRTVAIKRPKLDGFPEIIDGWLDGDRDVHRKQHHTAKRVFDRLREEHGFTGGYTIINDYVRDRQRRGREMFVRRGCAQIAAQIVSWLTRAEGSSGCMSRSLCAICPGGLPGDQRR